MPTYLFRNKETQEDTEIILRISELDDYKNNNPQLEQLISGAPGLSDPARLGLVKPAQGFRDLLKHMKSKHRRSTINDF
jgi:hypothetical protein